ncbi:MAG TPA: hypothetical protein VGL81_11180 [Polyangiaceae bacterium]|jgi:hypothetical protein
MAKAEPRDTTGRPGPVRTSSGTRVAAARLTPLEPSVASQRAANDISEMPTRELDVEQLRAMALHCASDIGFGEPAAPHPTRAPATDASSRPRLELVLTEDEALADAMAAELHDGDSSRSWRSVGIALVVMVVLALASGAVFEAYGVWP